MANILDYIKWRGDLLFTQVPFCDVDALVLSRLAYIPFDKVVSDEPNAKPLALGDVISSVTALLDEVTGDGRAVRIKDDEQLLAALLASERFCSLKLVNFVNVFDEKQQEQFCAITALLPNDEICIAFRGTDGTIVGWKEDFNMGFADSVPAQHSAVDYVEQTAKRFGGPIHLCGHSKGGNLAVYAGAFCTSETQKRIVSVRSNDGPGFTKDKIVSEGFQRIVGRTSTYLPQSSIVGMLLEHAEEFEVVHSTNVGIFQHDVYSWEIMGGGFVRGGELTNSSQIVDATLTDWVANMTPELREKMIDGIFAVLGASDGKTLRELWNGKNTVVVIKALAQMDDETRAVLGEAFSKLTGSMKKSLGEFIEKYTAEQAGHKATARLAN